MTKLDWNRPKRIAPIRSFPARFPGHCRLCDKAIRVGQICAYDEGRVVHRGCVG